MSSIKILSDRLIKEVGPCHALVVPILVTADGDVSLRGDRVVFDRATVVKVQDSISVSDTLARQSSLAVNASDAAAVVDSVSISLL